MYTYKISTKVQYYKYNFGRGFLSKLLHTAILLTTITGQDKNLSSVLKNTEQVQLTVHMSSVFHSKSLVETGN